MWFKPLSQKINKIVLKFSPIIADKGINATNIQQLKAESSQSRMLTLVAKKYEKGGMKKRGR